MNNELIYEKMINAFVLDSTSIKAAFRSALSNDTVVKLSMLWPGVRFRIIGDSIRYELKVI